MKIYISARTKAVYRLQMIILEEKVMSKKNGTLNTLPSVLAYEKKLVPSDGYFYGTSWEQRQDYSVLELKEKSIRGTVSNRLIGVKLKKALSIGNANLQTVDACFLSQMQDTLRLDFTLKILPMIGQPSACNKRDFQDNSLRLVKEYIHDYGFKELAKRYAWNIANARFFWRNRIGAERIEVIVRYDNKESVTFDAFKFPLDNFNQDNLDQSQIEAFNKLKDEIAHTLCGERPYLLLTIEAYALVGKAQEIYPSEELPLDKLKTSRKSKVLYEVKGQAAMHSQKIGNALRTIDTWYGEESQSEQWPIAIEVYGSVTNEGCAYRTPDEGRNDFYSLFDQYFTNQDMGSEFSDEQKHYVMAMLIRGGIFGVEKDKKPKKDSKDDKQDLFHLDEDDASDE